MSVLKYVSGLLAISTVVLLSACSSSGGGGDGTNGEFAAKDLTFTFPEDTDLEITLISINPPDGVSMYRIGTSPEHGVLTGTGGTNDPTYVYVPAENYFGEDSFTYIVNSNGVDSNEATVSLIIEAVNDIPVAESQGYTVDQGVLVKIGLFGSDVETDSLELDYRIVVQPSDGQLTRPLNSTVRDFEYTPNAAFAGNDSFTYVVNDGEQDSPEATITLTIRSTNKKPRAIKQELSLFEDNTIDIVLEGSDEDGNALTFDIISGPSNGVLTGERPNVTYVPHANYNGSDSFQFRAFDGVAYSRLAEVTLTIEGVNDAPVVEDIEARLYQDNVSHITLVGNDVDVNPLLDPRFADPGAISWTYRIETLPLSGILTGTGADRVYTPAPGFVGTDSFIYVATDDALVDSVPATVNLTVIETAASAIILNDTGITFSGQAISGNDSICDANAVAQDCNSGDDFSNNDNADGHAGFQFTKISSLGNELSAEMPEWSCVHDRVTGLIWEVKVAGSGFVADGGLHDADDRYTWYSTDVIANGGGVGAQDEGKNVCYGYDEADPLSYCNTLAYVDRVNSGDGLCGATDWRVPTLLELESIVDFSRGEDERAIDLDYFPETKKGVYWSSSAYAASDGHAWNIDFSNGSSAFLPRSIAHALRLVRTAPPL